MAKSTKEERQAQNRAAIKDVIQNSPPGQPIYPSEIKNATGLSRQRIHQPGLQQIIQEEVMAAGRRLATPSESQQYAAQLPSRQAVGKKRMQATEDKATEYVGTDISDARAAQEKSMTRATMHAARQRLGEKPVDKAAISRRMRRTKRDRPIKQSPLWIERRMKSTRETYKAGRGRPRGGSRKRKPNV